MKYLDPSEIAAITEQHDFPADDVPGVGKMRGQEAEQETEQEPEAQDMGTPIDENILAEGLQLFRKVVAGYQNHTPEGHNVAKWIIALSKDKRYAEASQMLSKIQELADRIPDKVGEIYRATKKKR